MPALNKKVPCPLCGRPVTPGSKLREHLQGKSGHRRSGDELKKLLQPPHAPPMAPPIGAGEGLIEACLRQLVNYKWLPKYSFERRVDALLAPFLPDLLSARLGGKYKLVVPEFPLAKPNSNTRHSTNADYLLLRTPPPGGEPRWCLFELKTDDKSIRKEQYELYVRAQERGMNCLRKELKRLQENEATGWQYEDLNARVDGFSSDPTADDIEIVYLAPGPAPSFFERGSRQPKYWLRFRELASVMDAEVAGVNWQRVAPFLLPFLR